jgi:hypothetical protein
MWFPYSWLGPWRYNPSEGLLLKFSGDVVYDRWQACMKLLELNPCWRLKDLAAHAARWPSVFGLSVAFLLV